MLQSHFFLDFGLECRLYKWTGKQHESSEDRLLVAGASRTLMISVLDGMGGLPLAAEAAATAASSILQGWSAGIREPSALLAAGNDALIKAYGAGTVGAAAAVAIVSAGGNLCGAWLGDARIAVVETFAPSLRELTVDHTRLAEHVGRRNPTRRDLARFRKLGSSLTRSLGERPLDVQSVPVVSANAVQSVVLYTDGFWGDSHGSDLLRRGFTSSAHRRLSRLTTWTPDDDSSLVILDRGERKFPEHSTISSNDFVINV